MKRLKKFGEWLSESHREEKVAGKTYSGEPIYQDDYDIMYDKAFEEGTRVRERIEKERKKLENLHNQEEKSSVLQRREQAWRDEIYLTIKQTLGEFTPGGVNNVSDSIATRVYDDVMKWTSMKESRFGVSGVCDYCGEEGLLPYAYGKMHYCCQTCMDNGKEKMLRDA